MADTTLRHPPTDRQADSRRCRVSKQASVGLKLVMMVWWWWWCRPQHTEGCEYCKQLYTHFVFEGGWVGLHARLQQHPQSSPLSNPTAPWSSSGKQYHLYYTSEVVAEALDPGPYPVPIPPDSWVRRT